MLRLDLMRKPNEEKRGRAGSSIRAYKDTSHSMFQQETETKHPKKKPNSLFWRTDS